MNQKTIRGKIGGYRSAASHARMRAAKCDIDGDVIDAEVWREKETKWLTAAVELAKLLE